MAGGKAPAVFGVLISIIFFGAIIYVREDTLRAFIEPEVSIKEEA